MQGTTVRRLAVVLLLLLLPLDGVAAGGPVVQFMAPATLAGEAVSVSGSQWALLVFDGAEADLRLPILKQTPVTNLTLTYPLRLRDDDTVRDWVPYPQASETRAVPAGATVNLRSARSPASVYVEATSLNLRMEGVSHATIEEKGGNEDITSFTRDQDRWRGLHRLQFPAGSHSVLKVESLAGMAFRLQANTVRTIEWFNVDVSCQDSSWCPQGGGAAVQDLASVAGTKASNERFSYERAEDLRSLLGHGRINFVLLGGPQLSVDIAEGTVRFPLASAVSDCQDCIAPANQTLTVVGDVSLRGLRRDSDGWLSTEVGGTIDAARFDEAPVDPRLIGLGFAGSAAAAAGLVLLAKVLLGLFTRLRADAVLDQPRRRLVFEAVKAHPGVGFRELTRRTGLSYGVVRHHLDFLLRHDRIVEHRHGSFVHFFDCHDRSAKNWRQVSTLNDAKLSQLHEWLTAHPGRAQQAVIAAMLAKGWSRAGTQRALERLAEVGLVQQSRHGRSVLYEALRSA